MARQAPKATRQAAIERVDHAIDVLDEAQAVLSEAGGTPEFWVGIIFSAQTTLRLVSEMSREIDRESARAARRKPAAKKRR
jgi:hypothetical protein